MASKSLGTLTLDLVAKIGGFEKGMDQAARVSEKRIKQITTQSIALGNTLGTYLTRSIDFAASKLIGFTKGAIDAADEVSKLSQKTGLSTEALSELQYAAGLSGVEDLGASLVKFNRSISEAGQGTKAQADAFKALGVNVKNADGLVKGTEQLLGETADAFAGLSDGANKSAVAMDLFGKTGADLIPFLNEGKKGLAEMRAEAVALGLSINEYTGKAAEQFNDNLDRLGKLGTGLGTRLATDLAPQLVKVTDYLVDMAKEGDAVGNALEGLRAGVGVIVVPLTGLWNLLQTIVQAFVAVGAAAGALARRDFAALEEIGNAFGEDRKRNIEDVTKAYELFFGQLENGAAAVDKAKKAGKDLTLPDAGDNKAAEEAKRHAEAIQQQVDALQEQAATLGLSSEQLALYRLAADGASEAQLGLARAAISTIAAFDKAQAIKETIEALELEGNTVALTARELVAYKLALQGASDGQIAAAVAIQDHIDQQNKLQDLTAEAAQVFDSTRTAAEKYAITLEHLQELRDTLGADGKPLIDAETFERAKDAAKEFDDTFRGAFEAYAESVKNVGALLGGDLVSALDSAIARTADLAANTLLWGEGGTEALKELARSIITDLVSSLIKAGVQMAANFTLQKAQSIFQKADIVATAATAQAATATTAGAALAAGAAVTAASLAEAASLSAAWNTAAIGASIATFGGAAAVGLPAYLAALASGTAAATAASVAGAAGFSEGGFTGMGGVGQVAGVVHGQEGVVSASALRAAADAINDPNFWSGNGGGMQLEVRNMGEPMDIRVERVGRRLIQTMTPAIIDAADSAISAGISSGLGRTGQAIGNTYGSQRSSQR